MRKSVRTRFSTTVQQTIALQHLEAHKIGAIVIHCALWESSPTTESYRGAITPIAAVLQKLH